ncbi:hypothetical protein LTR48_001231 [Friedmanniomyces endolithicus]|nr:hypothetical protein LTR48_001231 [Friedmanniomyces endolithicus]
MAAHASLPPVYTPSSNSEKVRAYFVFYQHTGLFAIPGIAQSLRYMLLHAQQASMHRRLSVASSPPTPPHSAPTTCSAMSTSETSSTASSPTFGGSNLSPIAPPTLALPKPATKDSNSRRPSMSPIPEHAPIHDASSSYFAISPDESKLYDVNHNIKSTLTELLNCEAVRHDHTMRLWVQTRLLDAEQELKRQRRRRNSLPSITLSPAGQGEEGHRRSSG